MSKELPEYERHQAITPAQQSGSFTQALSGAVSSADSISNLGAQIAQSSANEMATMRGLEAGKTPGQNLFPTIGEADKHFVQAYKQQEYAIAATQGADLLRKLSFEATKNPTPGSLQDYEKNAHQGLEGILGNVTPGTEAELRKAFDNSYSASYYQIAEQVEAQNNKIIKQNNTRFLDQRIKQSADMTAEGDIEGAKRLDQDTIEWVKKSSGNVNMTDPEAKEYIETIKKANQSAEAAFEMNRADILGLGEKLLEEQLLKPRTEENDRRSEAMLTAYKHRKSFQSAKNSILLEESLMKLESNQLGPMDVVGLQGEMNATTFASFNRQAESHFRKQQAQLDNFQFLRVNANKPFNLARMTGDQKDKALDDAVRVDIQTAASNGKRLEDNMLTRAIVASRYNTDFPNLSNGITAAVKSGNPEQMEDAGRAIQFLGQRNSSSISKIDGKVIEAAQDFNALVKNRVDPIKAAEMAMKKLDPMSDAAYAQLTLQLATDRKDYTSPNKVRAKMADVMDVSKDILTPGATNEFTRVLESFFLETGDWKIAELKTKSYMGASWGVSEFNGFKEYVYSPIDKAYPDSYHHLRQQLIEQCDDVFAAKEKQLESGKSIDGVYFEFDDSVKAVPFRHNEKQPGHIGIRYPILGSTPLKMTGSKILANGSKQKGTFVIQADEATVTPEDGTPSWSISFVRDGEARPYPLLDPKTGDRVRFTPNMNKVHKSQVSIEQKEYEWRAKNKQEIYRDQEKLGEETRQFLEERGLPSE